MSYIRLNKNFDRDQSHLKHKSLIVSESQSLIVRIETLFANQGWLAESMSAHLMIAQGSSSTMDYHCAVFVIDHHFRKCFNGLITEMSAVVRNASVHTPIYLLFENDDDLAFATWLNHVKKTFKSATGQTSMHDAVQNIICRESSVVQAQAPMFSQINAYA